MGMEMIDEFNNKHFTLHHRCQPNGSRLSIMNVSICGQRTSSIRFSQSIRKSIASSFKWTRVLVYKGHTDENCVFTQ